MPCHTLWPIHSIGNRYPSLPCRFEMVLAASNLLSNIIPASLLKIRSSITSHIICHNSHIVHLDTQITWLRIQHSSLLFSRPRWPPSCPLVHHSPSHFHRLPCNQPSPCYSVWSHARYHRTRCRHWFGISPMSRWICIQMIVLKPLPLIKNNLN